MLTGESKVASKKCEVVKNKDADLSAKKNIAFSGSLVSKGKAIGIVCATGMKTEMGKI